MEDSLYMLCAKVLAGEATAEEAAQVEAWKNASPGHRAEFDAFSLLWASAPKPSGAFDTAAAWAQVAAATGMSAQPATERRQFRLGWIPWGVAAALIVGFFLLRPSAPASDFTAKADTNQELLLPDGSRVSLRKGSTLSYPLRFDGSERVVRLTGEAFFRVARNERQPFIVHSDKVQVQVLGTEFNVAGTGGHDIVTVASGEVRVTSADQPASSVVLHKGEQASLQDGSLSRDNVTSDGYLYWKTGNLNFLNQPLSAVLRDLSAVSGKRIRLDSAILASGKQEVTIGFERESLEEMLTQLGLITHTTWVADRDGYIIRAQ